MSIFTEVNKIKQSDEIPLTVKINMLCLLCTVFASTDFIVIHMAELPLSELRHNANSLT